MKKLAIIYGKLETELQKRAIEELSSVLLEYTLEYPICQKIDTGADIGDFRCIYVGTKESNPYIKDHSTEVLTKSEEYAISIKGGVGIIEGFDDAGALWGVLDFYNKYVLKFEYPDVDEYRVNFLLGDTLPDFEYRSAPSVKERGLWTWGHVIYDYRRYLYNMMRLKMNRIVIWNDHAPTNAKDIVNYAHSVGIKVIWGFSWLWDTDCGKFDLNNLDGFSEEIFKKYEAVTLSPFFSRLAHSGLEIYLSKISLDLPLGALVRLYDTDGFFALGEVREYESGLAIKPIRQF